MSYTTNLDKMFTDEQGIYFERREAKAPHKLLGKTRPLELGYLKTCQTKIYIEKTISNSENLENETVVFEQTLTVSLPNEARFKYIYLYKTQNGTVHLKDFESGCTSAISINDNELVKRSKPKKLPENTLLLKTSPIYILRDGILERRLNSE
jgi:uncharacterized pyridoxamine 5'-phosphate oxidase family protein